MESQRAHWFAWASFLRRWGLEDVAAWVLEAGGPLTLIGAQFLYAGQPFLGSSRTTALAQLLEDNEESQAFAAFIREDKAS